MRGTFQTVIALSLLLLVLTSSCVIPAMIHLKQGDSYAGQGQTEEAIGAYSQAIELNPNLSAAYKGRGLAYFDQRQWALAITDLNKAIELAPKLATDLSPKLAAAYSRRGFDCTTQYQYALAIADLTKAIELDPDSATARIYADRGKNYLETGQHAAARKDYNTAIELDPKLLTGEELADMLRASTYPELTTFSIDEDSTGIVELIGNHVTMTMTIKSSSVFDKVNKKMRVTTSLDIIIPEQDKVEVVVERYVVDGWEYNYTKSSSSKTAGWTKRELSDASLEMENQLSDQIEFMLITTDIPLLGSEKIDGVDCHVLLAKPRLAVMTNYLRQQGQQAGIYFGVDLGEVLKTSEINEYTIKAWITKNEYLPIKMEMDMNAIVDQFEGWEKVTMNVKTQSELRDLNKPVNIELPPEALGAKRIYTGR